MMKTKTKRAELTTYICTNFMGQPPRKEVRVRSELEAAKKYKKAHPEWSFKGQLLVEVHNPLTGCFGVWCV